MKNCVKCGKEISDTAKFCGYCRAKQDGFENDVITSKGIICPACQHGNSPTAKFCGKCRHSLTDIERETLHANSYENLHYENDKNIDKYHGFITWSVLPGQLAVKIDEKEIDSYGFVKGLYVSPGTKAIFFVNGKCKATLESGKYFFRKTQKEVKETTEQEQKKGVISFMQNVASHIANGASALFGISGKPIYTVVLCRGGEFPLIYEFENVRTASVSCNIGLHFLCKISNINAFAENLLLDRKYVTLESIAGALSPYIKTIVDQAFITTLPEKINEDVGAMEALFTLISSRIQKVYSYIELVHIISATANNDILDHLRLLKEELYLSEQELEQVQLRNDFLNRLQDEDRNNNLRYARSETDYQALMDDIELDGLKNEDKRQQFILMLTAERELRVARTQSEMNIAINKLKQSNLLSNEEIEVLKAQIDHRSEMLKLENDQEIAMTILDNSQLLASATLRNEILLDKEKLRWEIEIGNQRFENELIRKRKENELRNEERNAALDMEVREREAQLDLLRKAQQIRNEREEAAHIREMDKIRVQNELEESKLNHDLEKTKIMSNLTFEQIMAINPNIAPEAANAFAEKFRAEAATMNNERYDDLAKQFMAYMKEVGQQNMDIVKELIYSQSHMQEMRLKDKEAEIDRIYQSSEQNTDRVLNSVKTTVTAVSGQPHIITPPSPVVGVTPTVIGCPSCGTKNAKGSAFCEECGSDLSSKKQ